jgi:hypothetical protein
MDWMLIGIGVGLVMTGLVMGLGLGLNWGSRQILARTHYPHMKSAVPIKRSRRSEQWLGEIS